MKIRVRRISRIEKNPAFDSLPGLTTFKGHLMTLIPHGFQTSALEKSLPQKLIEQEVERKQSTARAYVSMLPPR